MYRFIVGVVVGVMATTLGWNAVRDGLFWLAQLIQDLVFFFWPK